MQTSLRTYAGIRSPVFAAGSPQASDAVVFVHGNPGSSTDWSDLVEQVAPFSRAFAPDMPGFGQADKPADFDCTVAGYARHLGAMLDAEGIRRAHLVHDFGGPWDLAWAAQALSQHRRSGRRDRTRRRAPGAATHSGAGAVGRVRPVCAGAFC